MGSNWKTTTLADISERIGDGLHGTPKYSDDGEYYFVNGNNLESGAIVYKDSTKRVGLEEYNKHKKELGSSTLLVSINGTIGNVALYNGEEVVLGKSACYINLKKGISKEFVKYILSGYLFQEYIQRCSTGSTIKNVSLKMMRDFAFRIPDTEIEQDKAVELLKLLDHKISLNNQTNQTLEQMAQALFKSWFVDFDPVFDNLLASVDFKLENLENRLPDELKQKAQRRLAALNSLENAAEIKTSLSALAHELQALSQTKEATQSAVQAAETPVKAGFNANPKILAQHANTHAHFPNEFEHNEQLGWIPKGWEGKFFKEVIDKYIDNRGKTPPLVNNGIPLIEVKHIPESSNFPSFKSEKQFSLETYNTWFRAHVEERDILISTVGTIGRTAYVKDTKFGIAQNILGLRFGKHVNPEYMFYYIKSHRFQYDMDARLITTVQASIKRKDLDTITILVPDGQIQNRFSEIINSILTQQFSKKLESEQLAKLRDTLLPKLISGELQIPM